MKIRLSPAQRQLEEQRRINRIRQQRRNARLQRQRMQNLNQAMFYLTLPKRRPLPQPRKRSMFGGGCSSKNKIACELPPNNFEEQLRRYNEHEAFLRQREAEIRADEFERRYQLHQQNILRRINQIDAAAERRYNLDLLRERIRTPGFNPRDRRPLPKQPRNKRSMFGGMLWSRPVDNNNNNINHLEISRNLQLERENLQRELDQIRAERELAYQELDNIELANFRIRQERARINQENNRVRRQIINRRPRLPQPRNPRKN